MVLVMSTPRPPRTLVIELAAAASCDPRTADRAMRDGSAAIRGMAGYRVARAMARLGIHDPKPAITVPARASSDPPGDLGAA